MATLETRIGNLEKVAAASKPVEPVPIYFWPPPQTGEAGELARQNLETEIAAHRAAGRKVIVFHKVDASKDAPDPEPLPPGIA